MTPTEQPQKEPFFETPIEETPVLGSETIQKGKIGRKQLLLLLGGFAFLLGVAIFGGLGGFITSNTTPQPSKLSDGGASSLAPPEARPHGLDAREKYDKYGYDGASLNPTTSVAIERQAAAGTQLLTGKDPSTARGSNETLTDADLKGVGTQTRQPTSPYQTASERKAARRSQLKRQFDHQQAERDAIYRTMHRSPKGREQIAEEGLAKRERELDRQTADALLRQMETANKRLAVGPSAEQSLSSTTTLNMADYQHLKALNHGVLPSSYRAYFKREIDADNEGQTEAVAPVVSTEQATTSERKALMLNTVGFYGLAARTGTLPTSPSPAGRSIPAVIHGDGDVVTVQNGSTINIRLLEETPLRVNGKIIKLPAHTLLVGVCSINADRVNIAITSLRADNDIYPIRLTVFDLDGRPGLAVPKLVDKNRLAQSAASSAGQAVSSPYYFVPQGSFGQQVGSQSAMQVTNTAFQGVRSLVQAKLSAVKVTVRPNYRVILRPEQATSAFNN